FAIVNIKFQKMCPHSSPSERGWKRLYGLDHLRTLAILFVFLYHYSHLFPHPGWTSPIGKFGWTGVDLFFVLSGYLISSQLFEMIKAGRKISFPVFFIKRFFRIIPAYLFVLAIYFCIPYAREWEALAPIWKYISFTQNLGLDLRTQRTFSHAWSLCIEEQFYLALPITLIGLVYFKTIKKAFLLLIALFIFGFMIRFYSYNHLVEPFIDTDGGWSYWYTWIYYPTYCRLDGLLTGVSIAALFVFRPLIKERICQFGNWLLLLSVIVLTGAYFLCMEETSFEASVFGFPLVSFGYGFMLMGAVSPKSIFYKFNSKTTTILATLSYPIYLTHKIVIHITQDQFSKTGIDVNGNLMFLICIITCFIAAWMLNRLIEKPFLRLRDKLLRN
ncbi:MAG: acyltransferase, partial [Ferruginibacter sp.]